jgi:hypothetical protein
MGTFDARARPVSISGAMSHEIIDIAQYLKRRGAGDVGTGTMALWGAEGERSRFALPLWRIVHLAEADRGAILWRRISGDRTPHPFVVLDLASDPARLDLTGPGAVHFEETDSPTLYDLRADGLVVYLGVRDDRIWCLLADGGGTRDAVLQPRRREDILFLAGECAGLLFLRDFADASDD